MGCCLPCAISGPAWIMALDMLDFLPWAYLESEGKGVIPIPLPSPGVMRV